MAQYKEGFYVPGSISGSYVANKRTEEGSPYYEAQKNKVAQQKQAALQSLSKEYATTIENAYASYLAGKQGVLGSAMGEGFKDAYIQNQQQNLIQNIAQANQNVANVRAQLEEQEYKASKNIHEQYEADVANLDKVADSFANYRTYLESLSDGKNGNYFTDEQKAMDIKDLYDVLLGAQPGETFKDINSQNGMSYTQWINTQLKDTQADAQWYNWLMYQGGLQDFMRGTRQRKEDAVLKKEKLHKETQDNYMTEANDILAKYKDDYNTGNSVSAFGIGANYNNSATKYNYRKYMIEQLNPDDYKNKQDYLKEVERINKLTIDDWIVKDIYEKVFNDTKNSGMYNPKEYARQIVEKYLDYNKNPTKYKVGKGGVTPSRNMLL